MNPITNARRRTATLRPAGLRPAATLQQSTHTSEPEITVIDSSSEDDETNQDTTLAQGNADPVSTATSAIIIDSSSDEEEARLPELPKHDVAHLPSPEQDDASPEHDDFQPTLTPDWTADDELASNLFKPWDELPFSTQYPWTPMMELTIARRLERLIPFFDAHIGHSETGITLFAARHQAAMEKGWTKMLPSYRNLDGPWVDSKWTGRYYYMVRLRIKTMSHRLKINLDIRGKALHGF